MLILQMVIAAIAAVALYTFIGFIPGTDETSVLVPVTLALVLANIDPMVVLTFFISAIITLNLTNAIPTALVGLPGGVMSTPMMEHSLFLKSQGLAAVTIRKMAAGSVIGTLISIPLSLLIAGLIVPYAEQLREYGALLFVFGAVLLALLGKNKVLALIAIIPLSFLFQGVVALYKANGVIPEDGTVNISFFLAITVGPLLVALLGMLNKQIRKGMPHGDTKEIRIIEPRASERTLLPNKIMTGREIGVSTGTSVLSSFLFFLSPVGLTFLLGEASGGNKKKPVKRALQTVTSMNAIAHATYLSGVIIPLVAIGIPLSPVSIGPANALFNAPPVFDLDHNMYHLLSMPQFVAAIAVGAVLSLVLTYIIAVKYSYQITYAVMKYVPHEAVIGLFIGFILLLAYIDAGVANIFGVLLVGIASGTLNKLGVNYGVQFMTLYASSWIVTNLL